MSFALFGAWSRHRPPALGQPFRFYESIVLRPGLLVLLLRFGTAAGMRADTLRWCVAVFVAEIVAIALPERGAAKVYAAIPVLNALLWSVALVQSGEAQSLIAYMFFVEIAFAALRLAMASCALVAGIGAAGFGILAGLDAAPGARALALAAAGGLLTTGLAFLAAHHGRRRLHSFQRAHTDIAMTVHGLKNSLHGTAGFAELLAMDLDPADPRRELARRIQRGLADAHTQARTLLTADARAAAFRRPVHTNLRAAAVRTLDALRPFLELRAVRVVLDVPADLEARVAPEVLDVVLTELVQNAAEAMSPAGGVLTVTAEAGPPRLRLRDTGPGVPVELASRIFAPGFTTRSHGNGLGLAAARALLAPYRATLAAMTSESPGACFEIQFALESPGPSRGVPWLGRSAARKDVQP